MAKISITRPQSTGTYLYGSLRTHHSFVSLSIRLDNAGDHVNHKEGDDTGFKSAHRSVFKRLVPKMDRSKPSISHQDTWDPAEGKYRIGAFMGYDYADAPEVEGHRREVIEVMMSFEQFAELLSSTGHSVDCTVESLHPVGEAGVFYKEIVTPPPSIYDRAKRRLNKAQQKALEEIDIAMEEVGEMKIPQKLKETIRRHLERIEAYLVDNCGFVAQQASEEISSIAEGAHVLIMEKVESLVAQGKLPTKVLTTFRSGLLPAPEPEEE